LAVTAKEREPKSARRKRVPSVLEQMIAACDAERVAVHFIDGRLLDGALLFNPIKRSGKLINVEQEFSLDFVPIEVREIKVLQARSPTATLERATAEIAPTVRPLAQEDESDDD
jgi:hypothetical protein